MKTREVRTSDGWTLALLDYEGTGERGTVYLQHGLGSNAYNFDLPDNFSPARWLSERGWRVFAGNLRGTAHGGRSWTFSEKEADARALAAAVGELAGPFHWIGHSLGGILGLRNAHLARSVTTLGSALNYSQGPSVFRRLMPFERFPMPRLLPLRAVHRTLGPVLYAVGTLYRTLEWKQARAFHANQGDLSADELRELARRVVRGPHELPGRLPVPWFCVAGTHDNQCPPETARWTFDHVEAPKKDWLLVEEAAHVDLVIGRDAPKVWQAVETAILAAR